jgi:membrane dipeptidase
MGSFSGIELSDRAQNLLEKSIIIDCRDPTFLMYRFTGDDKEEYWEAVKQSGITAICVDPAWVDDGFRDAALAFSAWYKRITDHGAILALTADDFQKAKQQGKNAFVLNLQSPTPVENEVGLVEVLQRMGLRIMQLAYQRRNYLAEGVGEPSASGLSKLGFEVLEEMNRVGVVADLAHATEKTMWDVLRHSKKPVINSHSAVRSIVDHPRNMSDELLKALAGTGGVYSVSAYSAFLKKDGAKTGSTLDDWIRHVNYLVKLIGPDHVGIGFDVGEFRNAAEVHILHMRFKEAPGASPELRYVKELRSRRNFPHLVEALVKAGHSDEVIQKILGQNILRVFRDVWGA